MAILNNFNYLFYNYLPKVGWKININRANIILLGLLYLPIHIGLR